VLQIGIGQLGRGARGGGRRLRLDPQLLAAQEQGERDEGKEVSQPAATGLPGRMALLSVGPPGPGPLPT